jgi:hypothetical protein
MSHPPVSVSQEAEYIGMYDQPCLLQHYLINHILLMSFFSLFLLQSEPYELSTLFNHLLCHNHIILIFTAFILIFVRHTTDNVLLFRVFLGMYILKCFSVFLEKVNIHFTTR